MSSKEVQAPTKCTESALSGQELSVPGEQMCVILVKGLED